MAKSVITVKAREKMAKARAGVIQLPIITGMAFGDGGVNEAGAVLEPSGTSTTLGNELLRKEIDGFEQIDTTSFRYKCTIAKSELAGKKISEAALYDADGELVGIKNFSPKGKDADMEMIFEIDDLL